MGYGDKAETGKESGTSESALIPLYLAIEYIAYCRHSITVGW